MSALGASSGSQGVVASQSVLCKKNPGFGLSVGFRVSVGFGFGYGFSPESKFGLGSGFGFGFGCQTLHPNRTRPIAILKHIEH